MMEKGSLNSAPALKLQEEEGIVVVLCTFGMEKRPLKFVI